MGVFRVHACAQRPQQRVLLTCALRRWPPPQFVAELRAAIAANKVCAPPARSLAAAAAHPQTGARASTDACGALAVVPCWLCVAAQWRDDAFLTPVLDNDPLLFGLDVEDADFGDTLADADGVPPAAAGATAVGVDAAVSALLAENESLKLQARSTKRQREYGCACVALCS
jgi:hypothetical protein